MLTIPAFNALLKILEEPPEHLLFILATTELHKVPATVLSRCQRFSFKRILPGDLVGRLNYVAQQEGIDLTGDGAALLARLADGGMRDALSLLDQCAAAGGRIDRERVLEELVAAGNGDEDFGKRDEYMVPIEAPCYAVPRGANNIDALVDGLWCDGNFQCLDVDMKPIEGLFAVGNASGPFFGNSNYPMDIEGLSVGRAITTGFATGRYVAGL